MFSLKATELNASKIGLCLGGLFLLSNVALLQLYWMPVKLRAFLYFSAFVVGFSWVFYQSKKAKLSIGIDEQGAFLYKRGRYVRLLFVRANSIQLIAKGNQERARLGCVWPTFHVVYRDSVTEEQYSMLRSFAAQQILLHRSEETKKRFEP